MTKAQKRRTERERVSEREGQRERERVRKRETERGIEEDCVPKQRRTVCRETFTILIT